MIEHMHELMRDELKQTARTDTRFSVIAIILNFLNLAANSTISAGVRDYDGELNVLVLIIMLLFFVLVIVISFIAYKSLKRGQRIRQKLLNGFLKMYEDNGLSAYYDSSIVKDSDARYGQYTFLLLTTSATALLVPLLIATLLPQ